MTAANNSSVDQVFDVLSLLGGADEPIGVAQLARTIGVPVSTAHRVLLTLDEAGYVSRDTTGAKFQLGLRSQESAHALLLHFPIQAASQPFLRRVAAGTGETAVLSRRIGFFSVRMASAEGTNDVHAAPRLGQTTPLEETPAGRVILAFGDEQFVKGYARWTKRRMAKAWQTEQAEIRKRGLLLESHEHRFELAVPIRDGDGEIAAAISLEAGDESRARTRIAKVRAEAGKLESLLAKRPDLAKDPFAHLSAEELNSALEAAGRPS